MFQVSRMDYYGFSTPCLGVLGPKGQTVPVQESVGSDESQQMIERHTDMVFRGCSQRPSTGHRHIVSIRSEVQETGSTWKLFHGTVLVTDMKLLRKRYDCLLRQVLLPFLGHFNWALHSHNGPISNQPVVRTLHAINSFTWFVHVLWGVASNVGPQKRTRISDEKPSKILKVTQQLVPFQARLTSDGPCHHFFPSSGTMYWYYEVRPGQ